MAVTVNTQANPAIGKVGGKNADATIITSGITSSNQVLYQIENVRTQALIEIGNQDGPNSYLGERFGTVISVSRTHLYIILESRTKYRVRAKDANGEYDPWVEFTTRDKQYRTPDAITQLTDDTDSTAATIGQKNTYHSTSPNGGNRTIVVTNNAKATVTIHGRANANAGRGAKVVNTDTVFADGQLQNTAPGIQAPVAYLGDGARVINVPAGEQLRVRYTRRGATIHVDDY